MDWKWTKWNVRAQRLGNTNFMVLGYRSTKSNNLVEHFFEICQTELAHTKFVMVFS